MAQKHAGLPNETVFVECRAFVFYHQAGHNRWLEVGDPNVYSRVQLLGNRQGGSTGLYRIFGRLESSGMPTLNLPLSESMIYQVVQPNWHRIRLIGGIIYGLHFGPDSNGNHFSIIVQNILRSLQGTQSLPVDTRANWTGPSNPQPPLQNTPPAAPAPAPAPAQKSSDPSSREVLGALKAREMNDARIDALCSSLSDAVRIGAQDKAVELIKKLANEKLPLSIKLKNPVLVTMDSGGDTINLRVVVEDKQSSGGAFTMKVSPSATIERLKQEVFDRFSFPVQVQKWIIGKKIPKPTETLLDLNVRQTGHTVFLYLLSGKTVGLRRSDTDQLGRSHAASVSSTASGSAGTRVPLERAPDSPGPLRRTTSIPEFVGVSQPSGRSERLPTVQDSPPSSFSNHEQSSGPTTLPSNFPQRAIIGDMNIRDIVQLLHGQGDLGSSPDPQGSFVNNLLAAQPAAEERPRDGWACATCTFINQPTRPGCEMCSADRPQGYVVPDGASLDERERQRIAEEERSEALFQQAERTRQEEEEMARERNFTTLLQTAQQSLIPNPEEFDCGICYVPVDPGEGVVLRECLHRFCRDCLSEHIRHATDPEVQCPHQDENYACHATITGQEIKALLSPEDFNKFLNRSLATAESQAPNSFHCKTPNCQGWCVYEDNVNTFHCPVCNQPNCLTCKVIHANMNCKEYQDDLKRRAHNDEAARKTQQFLEGMVAGGEAMHCPTCEIILVKKDGCDWMRCSMCRTEICWATRGPRWGPGGTGDISGGCRCRVGGKKCHSKCRNCH